MILVIGATGTVGGELLALLGHHGAQVRALVRSPEKADTLRGYDCEPVLGDLSDPASLDVAMRGVDKVFLVTPLSAQQAALETRAVEAAQRAGVAHVVKLAALGFDDPSLGNIAASHHAVVEALAASGMAHTVLAPTGFLQNILYQAAAVQERSTLSNTVGDAEVSFVDARDVAEVAAHVLLTHGHDGAAYPITGPEPITWPLIASRLSALVGREIRYVRRDPEQARAAMLDRGLPEWNVDALIQLEARYGRGEAAVVTDEVTKATGRPARSLDDFLRDHAAAFR